MRFRVPQEGKNDIKHTDIATFRLNRPRSQFSEKLEISKIYIYLQHEFKKKYATTRRGSMAFPCQTLNSNIKDKI